jgi:hypothetical protein
MLSTPVSVGNPTPIDVISTGPKAMKSLARASHARVLVAIGALALSALLAAGVVAKTPAIATSDLSAAGFKVLVATTKAQEDWVQGLPPGKIRAMQRTGKKFFIYPDAPKKQIYIGGPAEYQAYVQSHPEHRVADAQEAAKTASGYRAKDATAMQEANGRDLSDPFLGATWGDLGWY